MVFLCSGDHLDLLVRTHSFPTRRSADRALRHAEHFPHIGRGRGDLRGVRDGEADLALIDDLGGGSHGIYGRAWQNRDGKQYPEVHKASPLAATQPQNCERREAIAGGLAQLWIEIVRDSGRAEVVSLVEITGWGDT